MISPAQIRAARAYLQWKQTDLAKAAGVHEISVKNVERGVTDPRSSTLDAIQRAFDKAGLVFVEADEFGGPGIRMKRGRR